MRRITILLLTMLTACRFEFARELGAGELRAKVVQVSDRGREPVAGVELTIDGLRLRTASDAGGRIVLRNVPPGDFTVRLSKRGADGGRELALVVRHVTLDPAAGTAGRDLGELALERVGSVEGRVLVQGAPVGDASVSVGDARAVTTDHDGRFRVAGLSPDTYQLAVGVVSPDGARAFGTVPAQVVGGKATEVELELSSMPPLTAGSVAGRALYLDGRSPADIAVQLVVPGGGEPIGLGNASDAGLYTSGGPVPAGVYVLVAQGPDGSAARVEPVVVNGDVSLPDVFLSGGEATGAHHLVVTGYPDGAKATVPQAVHVAAVDAFGNAAPGYRGTVAVTLLQDAPLEPVELIFGEADSGAKDVQVAFTDVGVFRIDARDVADSGIAGDQRDIRVRAAPVCGDGETDSFTGEECDDENTLTEACDYGLESCVVCAADCHHAAGAATFCGDGHLQFDLGEVCEDGNHVDDDECTAKCADPRCGDGIVQAGEACDDGNTDETDACTSLCRPPGCGDGFVQAGEACDDGNDDDTDACTTLCTLPACGDGFVQRAAGEECDGGADCGPDCRHAGCNGVTLHAPNEASPDIVVTSVADSGPGTLRAALAAATTGQVIGFDPAIGGTIVVASELVPASDVSIVAPPGGLVLDGNKAVRVLRVPAGRVVRLVGVKLSHGNVAGASGGCLDVAGTLVMAGGGLVACEISDNGNTGQGGGAAVIRAGGHFTLSHGIVSANRSHYRTGSAGFYAYGTVDVCWTTFTGNVSENGDGTAGALTVLQGATTILSSTFATNTSLSGPGGAVQVVGGAFTAKDSTFVGNSSTYYGGAIMATTAPVTLERCTIVNNSAPGNYSPVTGEAGGGVFAPNLTMKSCLVAGNRGAANKPDDVAGTVTSDGHNVLGAATPAVTGLQTGDLAGTRAAPLDVRLGVSGDFGGATTTVTLREGSPAFGHGAPVAGGGLDQRGTARDAAAPDSGAIEVSLPTVQVPVAGYTGSRRFDVGVPVDPGGLPTTVVLQWSTNAGFTGATTTKAARAGRDAAVTVPFRLVGLAPSTTYYVRAVATNRDGAVTSAAAEVTTTADP